MTSSIRDTAAAVTTCSLSECRRAQQCYREDSYFLQSSSRWAPLKGALNWDDNRLILKLLRDCKTEFVRTHTTKV